MDTPVDFWMYFLLVLQDIILYVFGQGVDVMRLFVAIWQSQMWPEGQAIVFDER